eukprot:654920-Rhodomonas_salina.1
MDSIGEGITGGEQLRNCLQRLISHFGNGLKVHISGTPFLPWKEFLGTYLDSDRHPLFLPYPGTTAR